jgi:hypothetical protein
MTEKYVLRCGALWFGRSLSFGKIYYLRKMVSSGMLRRVALVRIDVSEELSVSFIRITRIGELGTTLAVWYDMVYHFFAACVGC